MSWEVDSAGTNSYHTGEAPHHFSQKVAALKGIDISSQSARRFVKEDFQQYDKIYAMAPDVLDDMKRIAREKFDEQKVDLLLNELYPGQNKEVPDPWYGSEDGYYVVYDIIEKACDCIVKKYDCAFVQ